MRWVSERDMQWVSEREMRWVRERETHAMITALIGFAACVPAPATHTQTAHCLSLTCDEVHACVGARHVRRELDFHLRRQAAGNSRSSSRAAAEQGAQRVTRLCGLHRQCAGRNREEERVVATHCCVGTHAHAAAHRTSRMLRITLGSRGSKGNFPNTMAYMMMPRLHTSAILAS